MEKMIAELITSAFTSDEETWFKILQLENQATDE